MVISSSPIRLPCLHSCPSVSKWKCPFSIRSLTLKGRQYYPYPVYLPFKTSSRYFHHLKMKQEWMAESSWANTSNCTLKFNRTNPATTGSPRLDSRLVKPWLEGMKMFVKRRRLAMWSGLAFLFQKYKFSLSRHMPSNKPYSGECFLADVPYGSLSYTIFKSFVSICWQRLMPHFTRSTILLVRQ